MNGPTYAPRSKNTSPGRSARESSRTTAGSQRPRRTWCAHQTCRSSARSRKRNRSPPIGSVPPPRRRQAGQGQRASTRRPATYRRRESSRLAMARKVSSAPRPRPRATRPPRRGPARRGRRPGAARPSPCTWTRSAPMRAAASMSLARSPITRGVGQLDAQLARRLLEHAGARLAAVARPALVRAVVDGVDPPAGVRDRGAHARVHVGDVGLRVAAERDAALVRRHDDGHARAPRGRASPSERPGQERERVPRADVLALGRLAVDDAVAVEEDRAQITSRSASSHRMCPTRACASWMRGVSADGTAMTTSHARGAAGRGSAPRQADRRQAGGPRGGEAGEHVRRAAARGDPDRDVARRRRAPRPGARRRARSRSRWRSP